MGVSKEVCWFLPPLALYETLMVSGKRCCTCILIDPEVAINNPIQATGIIRNCPLFRGWVPLVGVCKVVKHDKLLSVGVV